MAKEKTDTIIITGFGPFGHHKVNASWEGVKALMAMPEVAELPVKLIAAEMSVSYEHILQKIPNFHSKENPLLMIHVGVSPLAKEITLERRANKEGYSKKDVNNKLPDNNSCIVGTEQCVSTILDVDNIAEKINQANIGVTACTSDNAGRYLCEFIYYNSLHQTGRRSLFVHVPELNKPYSAEQTGRGLYKVVCLAIKELSENEVDAKQEGASAL